MGKLKKDSNYDGNCTSRHCPSGTYEIPRRLIFVEQSVRVVGGRCQAHTVPDNVH